MASDGELVFTSLTKEAFPVIRYRTRDLTRLLPPTSRSFRRIGKITGRSDDMLIVRGVNVFPTQVEEQILRDKRLTGNYQIHAEPRWPPGQRGSPLRSAARAVGQAQPRRSAGDQPTSLQHHIKTIIGISTKVNVMDFDTLPRTQTGKARRVFDDRPKQL